MIAGGLGPPWPSQVQPAAHEFLQGHLIERPPFFYAADLRHPVWALARNAASAIAAADRGQDLVDLDPDECPPYGIITTQSCDLAEDRPDPVQPWFAVAPVYIVEPDSPLLEREFAHRLAPPELEGTWLADLRIEFPLEKGLLVGRTPLEGFPDEAGYIGFANHLARRRGRPALAPVFNEVIGATTRSLKQESSSRRKQVRRVRERVHGLRLAIAEGTRLAPAAAKLYVVLDGEPDADTRDWFGAWWDAARVVADAHGLQLLPVGYLDANAVDLRLYDDLVEVRNPLWT